MVRVALALSVAALAVALLVSVAVAAGSGGGSAATSAPGAHVHPHGSGYDPPPSPAPPSPPPPAASSSGGTRSLVATVGPAFTITLRRANGARLGRLPRGRYTISVDDRSEEHNFHLYGPGVNRRTGIAFVGQTRWTVTFRRAKQYRFRCDPHLFSMRGSFRTR